MALLDDGDTTAQNYGALFGGAGQSFVSPFMGQGGQQAAMDNSLLNMGAAMMQASGKSFDPSHGSFLSSLGAGIGAGQTAYQNSVTRGLQAANAAQSLRANQLAYAQNLMFLRAAAAMNPEGPAAQSPETSGAAAAAGVSTPGGGTLPALPAGLGGPMAGMPTTAAGSTPMPSGNGAGGGTMPATNGQPAGSGAGGPSNPLVMPGMNPRTAMLELLGNRQGYLTALANSYSPTDIQKQMNAMGIDPQSDVGRRILNASIERNTAPQVTRLSNGSYVQNGQFVPVPNAEGLIVTPTGTNPDGTPSGFNMSAVPGAVQAQTELATARAAGPATFKTVQTYNPVTKQMEATPQTINAQAAGAYTPPGASPRGNLPAPLRNNNPGALMTGPGGTLGSYPTMGAGMAAMDSNLQSYAKEGLNTVQGIVSKWNPANGKGNTQAGTDAYIADVAQQLGVKPGDTLNMGDPATRQALAMAMINHENGRAAVAASGVQAGGAPASTGVGMPTTAPLGVPQREQASQEAAAASMKKDYEGMQSFRQAAPAQLQALQTMRQIAMGKTILSTGPLGDTEAAQDNPFNAAPAEYEKQRSNYLTVAGATGTDAQRAQAAHSLPDYGKPKEAILQGIDTQIGQTQQGMLRAQFLTNAYNSGDATAYTAAANAFDQHITPKMATVLSMPPGAAQKDAYRALIKTNPALKANFQWALDNGMLK